ncbi:alpha/beta hydrolase family protein [Robertkochia solimangrovi]|uniref:S9 family peptidase n=1 Tax=Robertkochia solimangrovi TaxID=2213046 RepID=UPI0011817416|nr:S9 family peptidase [Robertkochia solimangrovi]TRZ44252.1 S9 family peptidase [Robertkochia solimangrovi]
MKIKLINGLRALLILFTMILTAQVSAQDVQGSWNGELDVQGNKLPLIFHIAEEEGNLKATMDSPAQGATGIPMDSVTLEENTVTITMAQAGIKYVAKVDGDSMEGIFYQGNMELPLAMKKGEPEKPGNPALVTADTDLVELASFDSGNYKYDVSDYFARPKASSFQFSPDGTYLSYREKDDNSKRHVFVKNTITGEVSMAIEEKEELIRGYGWVNNERLIYLMDKGGNENYHLFAVNIDGSENKELTPFEGVRAQIITTLKEDKDHIIISMNKNNPEIFEPYRINVNTGELVLLYENEDPANPVMDYTFDKNGTLRAFTKLRDGVNTELYYETMPGKYELIKSLSWKDAFSIVGFDYQSENPHDAYMISNLDSDKAEIVLYDLKEGKVLKKMFSNDDYDIGGLSRSRKRNYEIDYYYYTGDKLVIVPISETYKKLHQRITSEFPDYQYNVVGTTDEEDKLLVVIQSDKLYGTYYSYDIEGDKFTLLYNLMPQLKEADMAEMRPITFKSRDGVTLHGYITLPKAALEGQKVPVIVNPHGGPQGIRDEWGFNPEAQLFASRGYATLQVNFRISGGYGKDFLESGFKQIGRKAMDDVEDGLDYVVKQGWVDKDKAAIYGGSHGGYAVLRGLTKTPDLYACGVDYVGVSNLFTFMKTIPPYWKPYLKIIKEIWYDEDIAAEKKIMEEVSPVYHIDKIKKPLFVVQGANDPRVNIDESDQIVSALREKGVDVPYMVRYDEGHGFGKEENSIAMYEAMMGFFAKHLKEQELSKPIKN